MIRLPFLAAAFLAAPAAAHSPLSHADWCAGGVVVEVVPFAFDATQLVEAVAGYCAGDPRNCGEFDDPYSRATTTAESLCVGFQGATQGDIGEVVPIVTSPRSYLMDSHHADYHFAEGLEGACMRCADRRVALPPAPAVPIGPRTPAGQR